MPLNFHKNQKRGEFHDNKAQSTGRVNTFGQVAIQFHKNTHALRHWIDKAQDEAAACRPARCATLFVAGFTSAVRKTAKRKHNLSG